MAVSQRFWSSSLGALHPLLSSSWDWESVGEKRGFGTTGRVLKAENCMSIDVCQLPFSCQMKTLNYQSRHSSPLGLCLHALAECADPAALFYWMAGWMLDSVYQGKMKIKHIVYFQKKCQRLTHWITLLLSRVDMALVTECICMGWLPEYWLYINITVCMCGCVDQ